MEPGNTGKNFRENSREESLNPELSQEIDGFLKTSEESKETSLGEPLVNEEDMEDELLKMSSTGMSGRSKDNPDLRTKTSDDNM